MHWSTVSAAQRALVRLAPTAMLAACAGGPPATPTARSPGDTMLALAENWHAKVLVERDDSIVLTLPSGYRQLQEIHRRAGLTLGIAGDGTASLRLDSLAVSPLDRERPAAPSLVSWTGRADDQRINAYRVSAGGEFAAELTSFVGNLLPRIPIGGVRPQMTWTDSAAGTVRVDIFSANERRSARWTAGALHGDGTGASRSVQVEESYEQVGSGSQNGHRITMTSQGSRSGIYYFTRNGRLTGAQLADSATMLISLPDTRQMVPTIRYGRTSVQFIPIPRDHSGQ